MFELSGVNYYKKYCQIQGELDLVRVNEEFELSEFELAGDYCTYEIYYLSFNHAVPHRILVPWLVFFVRFRTAVLVLMFFFYTVWLS